MFLLMRICKCFPMSLIWNAQELYKQWQLKTNRYANARSEEKLIFI